MDIDEVQELEEGFLILFEELPGFSLDCRRLEMSDADRYAEERLQGLDGVPLRGVCSVRRANNTFTQAKTANVDIVLCDSL